jgi:cytochrome c biogenesis protein CcmG/thiol:disulfide interchange protein DsbE
MIRRFIPLALFVGVAALLAMGIKQAPRKDLVPSPLIGKHAPNFSLPSLTHPQRRVSTAQLDGHWYLFNVWGTWCISCREEYPELLAIAHSGVIRLIGLDWKDTRAEALAFLSTRGDPYQRIAFDPGGLEAIHWGVYGAPETFLVNPKGIIVYKYIGPITPQAWADDIRPRIPADAAVVGS